MPIKKVQFPDGSVRRVEVPEGASAEQILAFAQHMYQSGANARTGPLEGKPDFSNVRASVRTTETSQGPLAPSTMATGAPLPPSLEEINARNRAYRGSPEQTKDRARYEESQTKALQKEFRELPLVARLAIGAGSRVAAAGRGGGQLAAVAADFIDPRERNLSDLITNEPVSRYEDAMAREAEARRRDQFMAGDAAATVGGIAGDVGLLALPGGALTRAAGGGARGALLANTALGAGYAGVQPVIEGESRGTNAAIGGAFGAGATLGVQGLAAAGRRAANAVAPEVRQMVQRAQDLGIPVHASQVSQSLPIKVAASAGKYLPFSGYAKAASRQQEGVNRAVARTFGADAARLSDDVMDDARRTMSREFEAIYNRNAVPITEKGARRLAGIEREASRRLTNDEAQVLRNQLDEILANAEDGVLTGQKYQAVRTSLKKAEGPDKLGTAVRELRLALDDLAAESVGPQDTAALKALRSGWANFRVVEKALKQNAGAGGDIKLGSLWPLIRKGSTKEMRELARMGQTLLKDPIADSGTAQRSLLYNMILGGTSLANPALIPLLAKVSAGGATLGRAANSNTLAKLLARPSRGKTTRGLADLMKGATPYTVPAAAAEYNRQGNR